MRKPFLKEQIKKHFLVQAVLASSIFVIPMAYAVCEINVIHPGVLDLSVQSCNGEAIIKKDGQAIFSERDTVMAYGVIQIQNNGDGRKNFKATIEPDNIHRYMPPAPTPEKPDPDPDYPNGYSTAVLAEGGKGGARAGVIITVDDSTLTIGKGSGIAITRIGDASHGIRVGNGVRPSGTPATGVIINNEGEVTMRNMEANNANAIFIDADSEATLNNKPTGKISTNEKYKSAIQVSDNAKGFTLVNEGEIVSDNSSASTIYSGSAELVNITNIGKMINGRERPNDGHIINLESVKKGTFIQRNGEAQGHVNLAQEKSDSADAVFILEGGTIAGTVTAQNKKPNTFKIIDGEISGSLIGGSKGDSFNQSGGSVITYQGSSVSTATDSFVITGGSFGNLNASVSGTTTVDINPTQTYTLGNIKGGTRGNIDINIGGDNINILGGAITNLSKTLTIAQNSKFELTAKIDTINTGNIVNKGTILVANAKAKFDFSKGTAGTGTFSNNGVISLGTGGRLDIKGGIGGATDVFTNETGSSINFDINDTKSGLITVSDKNVILKNGSSINVSVKDVFPRKGTQFDVIQVTAGGTITDNSDLIQPTGAWNVDDLFKKEVIGGNILRLEVIGELAPKNCIINTPMVDHFITATCENSTIIVTSSGKIENKNDKLEVLSLDNDGGKIIIEAGNTQGGVKAVLAKTNTVGKATIGIHVTGGSKGGEVTIGAGSGVSSESTKDKSHAIAVVGRDATINNSGTIQLSGTASINANAIFVDKDANVTVKNKKDAVISTADNYKAPVIELADGAKSFVLENAGLISNNKADYATIYSSGNAYPIDITNNGDIKNNAANGTAIDIANSTQGRLTQKDGNIIGHVLLAQTDASGGRNVFTLEGGTISGDVKAKEIKSNTFTLSGGELTKTLVGGKEGDIFNQSKGKINAYQGNAADTKTDEFNITGGEFTTLTTSNANNSTTNVHFTPTGKYTAGVIEGKGSKLKIDIGSDTKAGAIVTAAENITGLNDDLTVFKNNTLVPTTMIETQGAGRIINKDGGLIQVSNRDAQFNFSNGEGYFSNVGKLDIGSSGVLTIKGNDVAQNVFTNEGTLMIEIDSDEHSRIEVESNKTVDFMVDSFINLTVKGKLSKTQFDIIKVNGDGTINDGSMLLDASGFGFTKETVEGGKILRLTRRDSRPFPDDYYRPRSSTPATPGIGDALDVLREMDHKNNDFNTLFEEGSQLFPDQMAVEKAMESLLPSFNGAVSNLTKQGMDELLNAGSDRGSDVLGLRQYPYHQHHDKKLHQSSRQQHHPLIKAHGLNYGDDTDSDHLWVRVLGGYTDQGTREKLPGYIAKGAGLALGADFKYNDCSVLGLAVNYYKANADDKSATPKDLSIKSWQGMLYGYFDFQYGLFLDLMVTGSANDYKVNRVIAVNTLLTTAQASFNGTLWGAQSDLGMVMPGTNGYFLASFVRAKYLGLALDSYVETGAGDLGLSVNNSNVNEFMGGVGLKLSTLWQADNIGYSPELSALIGYDFVNDGESSIANFIGGGPAFTVNGIKSAPVLFDLSLGLNVVTDESIVLSVKYDLEMRDKFFGNAGYVQYSYLWS